MLNDSTTISSYNIQSSPKMIFLNWLVAFKKKYILRRQGPFIGLDNKELHKEYNIPKNTFDVNKKKHGISGIARLLNAQDFLELCIESHLPYFDEIILADNVSDDNTWDICQKLQAKYPYKIKAIQYPFRTHKLGSDQYSYSTEDSVYDLSYFYNWVLSHVSYRRVAKVDDDHLIIPEIMESNRKKILEDREYRTFYHMPGMNVILKKGQLCLPKSFMMGLYGDHGFFPISSNTYFVHDKKCENFVHNLDISFLPISFFHLKYLKKNKGTTNYIGSIVKDILKEDVVSKLAISDKIKEDFFRLYHH